MTTTARPRPEHARAAAAAALVREVQHHALTTDTVDEAARTMRNADVDVLPVVDEDGSISTLISARDIVMNCVACGTDPTHTRVEEVAGATAPVAAHDDSAEVLLQLMVDHRSQHVLVKAGERVCGIVTHQDVSRRLAGLTPADEEAP